MPTSNYPNGFANGVNLRGLPVLNSYAGNVFWVDSVGGSDGNKGTFDRPKATVAGTSGALSACTANNGDIIIAKPGHVETIGNASITINKAGVAVLGLGVGSDQAKFTHNHANSEISIAADNITWAGFRHQATITSVLVGIEIEDASDDCVVSGNRFDVSVTTTDEFIVTIRTNDASVRALIENNDIDNGLGASVAAISFTKDTDGTVVRNNRIRGDYSTACIQGITTLSTKVLIEDNLLVNGGEATADLNTEPGIELLTGSTGTIRNNTIITNLATPDLAIVADACMRSGNVYSETVAVEADATAVPATDSTANFLSRDVIGSKADATATGAVTATDSLMNYAKQLVTELQVVDGYFDVPTVDGTADTTVRDVVGKKSDANVYVPGTTKSLVAYLKGNAELQEKVTLKAAAVMVNNDDIFTITGGPIEILSLVSECVTANDGTASTLTYEVDPTTGVAVSISGASASLASAAAGATVALQGTALSTAALLNASGGNVGQSAPIVAMAGVISILIAVGSTTGTWRHYLRWRPLATGVTVA